MSAQRRFAVGTTPMLIANPNINRHSIRITFLPSAIESGNTGRVHVGKGFPPSATLGSGNQGDPLNAASEISDVEAYPNDPTVFKGAWWAIATASDQVITVDEI